MATKVAASRTVSTTTAAMAIASRASRACDVCASKGARWYCGADAAYLCDRCDTQVHTANSLAQRHERVRLTPAGIPIQKPPRKTPESTTRVTKTATTATKKKSGVHSAPPQVLPARKRTRTSRPHPHRRTDAKPDTTANAHVKVEDSSNLFADFFHTEDFLIDHPQEVPSLLTDGTPSRAPSVSETGSERGSEWGSELGSEWGSEWGSEIQEYSPSTSSLSPGSPASEDSFAVYFKGKAAHQALEDDDVITSTDQFGHLVPESNSPGGIDIICCDADGNISLAGDACFIPGDIPGLDVFDDCSLSFDLALRGASEAFEGESTAAGGILASKNGNAAEISDQYVNGPFAKYFVTKKPPKTATTARWSPEIIKSEAREILRCCTEPGDAANVPTLRLNYEEIITAWSGRGEPWVSAPELCNATIDVGLVPDMEACDHGADDGSSCGGREARVLRYKEKRRSRLFSKTIRYEVRKLNADRRPRMKGRFVKRPTNTGPMIS